MNPRELEVFLVVGGKRFKVLFTAETKPEIVEQAMDGLRDWLLADPARAERVANGVAEGV